jgi:hypothetical protein
MFNDMYLSPIALGCYEGEGAGDVAGDGSQKDAAKDAAQDATNNANKDAAKDAGKTFTQADVNKFLAEDRRKEEAKYKAQLKSLLEEKEGRIKRLLQDKDLSEQQRDQLKSELDTVGEQLKDYRSKEETLRREKKQMEDQLTGKLTATERRAQDWENRYRESHINRELQDAAATNDAYNSRQIVSLLRPKTKMVPVLDGAGKETGDYQVVVDLDDVVDGKPAVTQLTPQAAVKRMKELPETYGNLFKSGVVSGVGSNSATGGLSPGSAGKVDLKNMSQDQYRKTRKEHPELLGLARR